MINKIATYERSHSMGKKGRLYVPTLREYGPDLILTRSSVLGDRHNNYLCVCPRSEFEKMVNRLIEKCSTPRAIRKTNRYLCGSSVGCSVDNQERITILKSLRQSIGMPTSVIIKEVYEENKILEIWNEKEYNLS